MVALLGPSSCVKTTTLRLIAGLKSATAGKVIIGGKDITYLSATYRAMSTVFQSYALFPHMAVRQNMVYGLTVKGIAKNKSTAKADEGLEMVGLKGSGDRLPSELSSGQQQRVAVVAPMVWSPKCCCLMSRNPIWTPSSAAMCARISRQIQQKLGLAAMYVTREQRKPWRCLTGLS